MNRYNLASLTLAVVGTLALFSGSSAFTTSIPEELAVTPEQDRFGAVLLSEQEQQRVARMAPKFALDGPVQDSNGAKVFLWDAMKAVNGGKNLPAFRQETGDCVSWGWSHAIVYASAVQVAQGGDAIEVKMPFPPYIYSQSRMKPDCGAGQLRGAGSVGEWAATAVNKYGVLFFDDAGTPKYSGATADKWGNSRVPSALEKLASDNPVQSVALVRNYEECRDAIANGYPVTVCSDQGFETVKVAEGRLWGYPTGQWAHCMCFIGVDDTIRRPGARKNGALYCLNSWGAAAHGKPTQGEPEGGFWVDAATADRMFSQMDSYAVSSFSGFPLQELDFVLRDPTGVGVDLVSIEPQGPQDVSAPELIGMEVSHANSCGVACLLGAALLSGSSATSKRRSRRSASQQLSL